MHYAVGPVCQAFVVVHLSSQSPRPLLFWQDAPFLSPFPFSTDKAAPTDVLFPPQARGGRTGELLAINIIVFTPTLLPPMTAAQVSSQTGMQTIISTLKTVIVSFAKCGPTFR